MKERRDMACSSASVRSIIFYIDGASLVGQKSASDVDLFKKSFVIAVHKAREQYERLLVQQKGLSDYNDIKKTLADPTTKEAIDAFLESFTNWYIANYYQEADRSAKLNDSDKTIARETYEKLSKDLKQNRLNLKIIIILFSFHLSQIL